jgi:hypothetical protein
VRAHVLVFVHAVADPAMLVGLSVITMYSAAFDWPL